MNFKKFNPGKKITVFFIFFAATFFLLGMWQVERGHEKSNIIEQFNNNITKTPKSFSEGSSKYYLLVSILRLRRSGTLLGTST